MRPIIEVKGLSKRYKLGVFNAKSLREEAEAFLARFSRGKTHTADGIGQTASGPATSNSLPATAEPSSDFWALRDVSFDVQPGEVIGVIGRNGAGKSTLLKILSRITEPTSGEARIRGRVASLLEVGTGFHPELTGRENIFLNGAILGMSKAEIRSKFDEIVAFAEIEKFIDTPVKRYSSGMYVRLAFAVAAHLEPEILIVDEVLAVGDASFQKKCLGKMKDLSRGHGRTVLFVSHNMAAVQSLCTKALLLEDGTLKTDGSTALVVGEYLRSKSPSQLSLRDRHDREGTGEVRLTEINLKDSQGHHISSTCSGHTVLVELGYERIKREFWGPIVASVGLSTSSDVPVFLHHSRLNNEETSVISEGGLFTFTIERLPLPPGTYSVNISIVRGNELIDCVSNAAELMVEAGNFYGRGEVPPASHGLALIDGRWTHRSSGTDANTAQ